MSLQCKFFVIPIKDIEETEEEINRFLRTVRVVSMQREFVNQGENSFWSMIVEYQTGSAGSKSSPQSAGKKKPVVDYREVLSPEDFAIYAKLREWRKEVANKEGDPVYTVFTNEQMAKIVRSRITTKTELQKIKGVGESRTQKYGEDVIRIMAREIGTEQKNSSAKGEIQNLEGVGETGDQKDGEDVIRTMSRKIAAEQKNRTDQAPDGKEKKKNKTRSERQKKENETDGESLLPNFDV